MKEYLMGVDSLVHVNVKIAKNAQLGGRLNFLALKVIIFLKVIY